MIKQYLRGNHARVLRFAMFLALLLSLLPGLAHAQTESSIPPFNGIAHFAIRVHDVAVARDFYKKLGFEQAFDLSKDGVPYEFFLKINDTQFIELYHTTDKEPRAGFLHICLDGVDLNAIHDDYASRGLTPKPVNKSVTDNILFTMTGPMQPFGPQLIEYTQYLPDGMHRKDEGKHLDPDRVADKLIAVTLAMQNPMAARDFYINQLNFKPIAGDPMHMHLPGNSGQEVEIAAASMGSIAKVKLQSENLGKAARRLRKEGVSAIKNGDTLTVTDPDGNIIVIEAR